MVTLKTDVVRREAARRNWTLTELARRVKTSPAYLSHILCGRKEPGPDIRSRLMKELGLDFDSLFDVTEVTDRREPARPGGKR